MFLYEREIRNEIRNGNLEAHIAFSNDDNGLEYKHHTKELVEKTIKARYVDSIILDQASDICDIILPKELGGLGGYIYVCGSSCFYETVLKGLLKIVSQSPIAQTAPSCILARAFSERRIMLDIFSTPKPMSTIQPTISLANLARNTGHRENSRIWIGVHGCVYDVTDFLPIHPGGTLIVSTCGGLDASRTFDQVGHTNNGEVRALLEKYFIGYILSSNLASPLCELKDAWATYLRQCVESLTTLCLEAKPLQNEHKWFSDGLLNMDTILEFYQFQSRFLENLNTLFGEM